MEAIIDNIAYYDLTEVQHKNPNFGKEAPNANKVIEKEKIPADAFIFVSFSKKKGKFTKLAPDSTYKSRKCMILKSWIDAHVHPFAIGKLSRDDNHKESKKYPPLPDMITLSEEEQFKDVHGAPIPITVRGIKHDRKNTFFKAKDVATMLEMNNLKAIITNQNSTFIEGAHYVYFFNDKDNQSNNTKVTYITYLGFLKLVYTRKHPLSDRFAQWATDIVFTHHMGNQEQNEHALQNIPNTFSNICSNDLSYQERKIEEKERELQIACQFTQKEHEMRLIASEKGNMIIKSLLDKINNTQ